MVGDGVWSHRTPANGGADLCWEPGTRLVLNNDGDMVLLLDESGRVAARYRYQG